MRYFISDLHFGHNSITGPNGWERTEFMDTEEHDLFLINRLNTLAKKYTQKDELWILGDWFNVEELPIMNNFLCKTIFVYGNHDKEENFELYQKYFDEVHRYPVFLSNKLIVSHIPVAVYDDMINICGHLHGSHLVDLNHICVSAKTIDYTPLPEKNIVSQFSKLPKYNRRFLWEPYAADMVFHWKRDDVVTDKDGKIDLAASRALQAIKDKEKRLIKSQNI